MLYELNLTGQRFGRLTAIRKSENRVGKSGRTAWVCQCDCGNVVEVETRSLRSGAKRSCGCLMKEKFGKGRPDKAMDLTGQKFGKLTAIRATEERNRGSVMWECQCDCGNTALVKSSALTSGATRSCGCLKREKRVAKKSNPSDNEQV